MLETLKPLLTLLYRILEGAIQESLDFFSRKNEDNDGWCFSALVRYHMKIALKKRGYDAREEDESSDEGEASANAIWQLDGSPVIPHYQSNNGLLLVFKGYSLRILKKHRRFMACATSDSQADSEENWIQLCFDLGETFERHDLLIVWDTNPKYHLTGLTLIKPQRSGRGLDQPLWSIPIPHPVELINVETIKDQCMFDHDLPVAPARNGRAE